MKLILLVLAMVSGAAFAATPAATRAEINHLLEAVEKSQCKFNRNGSWYDARKAREHLGKKFAYMDKKDLLPTTEVFIDKGASTSSASGKPYLMQCQGKAAVNSAVWLNDELKRYRKK